MMKRGQKAIAGMVLTMALMSGFAAQAQTYVHLDAAWSKANDPKFKDKNPSDNKVTDGANDAGHSSMLGIGVGGRFNSSLRGEFMVGYRGGYRLGGGTSDRSYSGGDIRSFTAMANGYYDFSSGRIAPYVGAGIGLARNDLDPVTVTFTNPVFSPLAITVTRATLPGGATNNFAFALMAGIGLQVSNHLILDIGYRYMDLGKVASPAGTAALKINSPVLPLSGSGQSSYSGAEGKLTAHELTVGIRF